MRYEIDHISIGHLNCIQEAELLKDKIKALGYQKEILITKIGCVLASHSGSNPLGIVFSVDEKGRL